MYWETHQSNSSHEFDELFIDVLLLVDCVAGHFADADQSGIAARKLENPRGDEPVV